MKLFHAWLLLAFLPLACRTDPEIRGPERLDATPRDAPQASEDPSDARDFEVRDGSEALELLLAGNARFASGRSQHKHESLRRRALLAEGQHPFAVVLGCADSRVPPELIFDSGLGDLFVIRVAGNVAETDEAGTIEYATDHLDAKLVLVLGHEQCGAVTAALDATAREAPELRRLLAAVELGEAALDETLAREERVHLGVEANVRESVARLLSIGEREGLEGVLFVGAVYELETGRVRVLD